MTKTVGLLVMAYGTPYKESDIEPYYTDIRPVSYTHLRAHET